MHAVHTTPGFIIDSRAYGEADKLLSIFTEDLGLVTAVAQGIRFEKSKLRYYAQNHSFSTFSLVRGRELWRLTSAKAGEVEGPKGSHTELVARIALLLKRLLQGEEAHPTLFQHLQGLQVFLVEHLDLDVEQSKTLESIFVLRILESLGYVGSDPDLAECLGIDQVTVEFLNSCTPKRTKINTHINKALKESHL